MKNCVAVILVLIFCTCVDASAQSIMQMGDTITLAGLFDEMMSAEATTAFPSPFYSARQLTSYDRRSVIPGTPSWHANDDFSGFIRYEANNGRVEKVLFDEKGPGVITRIITTGKSAAANLRIYFDDEKEASITIPSYDISKFPVKIPPGLIYMHEHYAEWQGSSFYYPLPYSKRCKITVDNLNRVYVYHVNYRSYSPGTTVKTFSLADAQHLSGKAEATSTSLLHPENFIGQKAITTKLMKPGTSIRLDMPSGAKAIRTLKLKIDKYNASEYAQLMRGLIIKITFDGQETVHVPLSDFCGAGMGAPKTDSWWLSADGAGEVIIRFVMPYRQHAAIELQNLTSYTASAGIEAQIAAWQWNEHTLYFHASWRQQRGLHTNEGLDYNMASIKGRGVFKGDVLSLYNHCARWYGEGDEHIWVDNDSFPSHFGCGTEDYYNTTYAPIHPYHNPFGGAPREDDEASRGYNTFFRTRNLDAIPFNQQLKFDFELISWDGGLVDYASTVFWYGDIGSSALNASRDEEALQPLLPAIFTNNIKK